MNKLKKLWQYINSAQMTKWELIRNGDLRGELYREYKLYFKWFFIKWSIRYDLTMFDTWRVWEDHWTKTIESKGRIMLKAIEPKEIF